MTKECIETISSKNHLDDAQLGKVIRFEPGSLRSEPRDLMLYDGHKTVLDFHNEYVGQCIPVAVPNGLFSLCYWTDLYNRAVEHNMLEEIRDRSPYKTNRIFLHLRNTFEFSWMPRDIFRSLATSIKEVVFEQLYYVGSSRLYAFFHEEDGVWQLR